MKADLAARLTPLHLRTHDGTEGLWVIEMPENKTGISYIWDPVWVRRVTNGEYTKLGTTYSFHSYGYVGLFKPSIAEVLESAPAWVDNADAFSIEGPRTADDMNSDGTLERGTHRALVTWWKLTN